MQEIFRRVSDEEIIYTKNIGKVSRGTLRMIHLADLHFGDSIEPRLKYEILDEQCFRTLELFSFDILAIDGDLYDKKVMAGSQAAIYANMTIGRCINICKKWGATLVVIKGTLQHDSDQWKSFYHYLKDPTIDIRIVERVKFEYIKGAKILCIPEMYDMGSDYYNEYLFNSGLYDAVFMHGAIEGSIYQAKNQESGINSEHAPIFNINDFAFCKGLIISGHVHTMGCYNKYFYHVGSPIRTSFGEEADKGYMIVLQNLDSNQTYVHFEPITSFRYDTIDANELIKANPEKVIDYLNNLKNQGIHNIRLDLSRLLTPDEIAKLNLIKQYYKNDKSIKFKYNKEKEIALNKAKEESDSLSKYAYLNDKNLTPEQKVVRYVNDCEGTQFITVDELISLLSDI